MPITGSKDKCYRGHTYSLLPSGKKECRVCNREATRRYYRRNREQQIERKRLYRRSKERGGE